MHIACPDCGSSDGLTVYQKGDGFCFAQCELEGKGYKSKESLERAEQTTQTIVKTTASNTGYLDSFKSAQFSPIPDRGITLATAKKYNALVRGSTVMFGYANESEVVAAKVRKEDKQFQTCGEWASVGL